jgi:L-alanine-DL-glutamate epimerase-like enolase superfamily enzyme
MTRRLTLRIERWPLARPFIISRGTFTHAAVIVAEIAQDGHVGRGEAAGMSARGDTPEAMATEVESVRGAVEAGAGRDELARLLPPGGALNALDCALWELEARLAGRTVAELAGLAAAPVTTVKTVSIGSPEAMAEEAATLAGFPIVKVKLGADDPVARIAAVRAALPHVRLIVDANAAWSPEALRDHAQQLADLGVELIEQPCPPALDGALTRGHSPIPLCADESCLTAADLPRLGAFRLVNIKLDKTGGLTGALALARAATAAGFELMVGSMLGTSLAMAPASLIAPLCRYVDLDGPLLLMRDRAPGMAVDGSRIAPMSPGVWG